MTTAELHTPDSDYEALSNFVVDCAELTELENKLGDFNLFQVLRSEFTELKHSNVLAWLFDTKESHGLDALFLQKWLMRVTHAESEFQRRHITPVDIDSWDLKSTDVYREWHSIDLLLVLTMGNGDVWVISIENKVNALQSEGQLERYRLLVEREFPHAKHRVFVFLTKNKEAPADPAYMSTSYQQVHTALAEAVVQRRMSIGNEPRVLIDNYLRLLQEKFMNQSEISILARKIYKQHRRAIDVIIENRPQNTGWTIIPTLRNLLTESTKELGIVMAYSTDSIIRFIPREWNAPGNQHGKAQAWGGSNLQILFEIDYAGDIPKMIVVATSPSPQWTEIVQRKCDGFPHLRDQPRSGDWPRFFSELIDVISLDDLFDPEVCAQLLFEEVKKRLASDEMKLVIKTIADELPALEECHRNLVS